VGGSSRRMGTDKATLAVLGTPLGVVAVRALHQAGLTDVVLVGGSSRQAAICGAPALADLQPGSGPRGGVISALEWAGSRILVVLACDLPHMTAQDVVALLDAADRHPSADVIVATSSGRRCPPTGVWRARAADRLRDAPGRSFVEAWSSLAVVDVELGAAAMDVDTPAQVAELDRVPELGRVTEPEGPPR